MNYAHLSTSVGTFLTGTGTSKLYRVNVNASAASSVVTIYEGTTSLGNTVAVISGTSTRGHDFGGIHLTGGMFVTQTGGNGDITISYE